MQIDADGPKGGVREDKDTKCHEGKVARRLAWLRSYKEKEVWRDAVNRGILGMSGTMRMGRNGLV